MPRNPRTGAPAQRTASDVRSVPERILAAGIVLVQTQGLQALSQARVAAAAGLRQSHLTYYFPTRKDLIKAIVQSVHAGLIEGMSAAVPAGGLSAAAAVREFFAQRIREPLMARLMLALMNAADEDPSLRLWLTRLDQDVVARLREIFTRLGLRPTEDELALLHASFVGAAVLGTLASTEAAAERAAHLARLAFDRMVEAASRPAGGDAANCAKAQP